MLAACPDPMALALEEPLACHRIRATLDINPRCWALVCFSDWLEYSLNLHYARTPVEKGSRTLRMAALDAEIVADRIICAIQSIVSVFVSRERVAPCLVFIVIAVIETVVMGACERSVCTHRSEYFKL